MVWAKPMLYVQLQSQRELMSREGDLGNHKCEDGCLVGGAIAGKPLLHVDVSYVVTSVHNFFVSTILAAFKG